MMRNRNFTYTCDDSIRAALIGELRDAYKNDIHARVVEELGIQHGAARVDVAVVNGMIHGYELKSDMDTLRRLPEQMKIYNTVLDRVTLVVGKNHVHEAIKIIPEWWGIKLAKVMGPEQKVSFCDMREADDNPQRDYTAVASLLWREEALELLEQINQVTGLRSKPRRVLYERLASVLDQETLSEKVRDYLSARIAWRAETQHI